MRRKISGVSFLNGSGVWISRQFPGSRKFNARFARKYGGTVSRVSFANGEGQQAIGMWISRLSSGDLRGFPIDPRTLFVIANIQVFDGNWASPFDSKDTRPDTFHGRNGDETAQMMWGHGVSSYRAGKFGEVAALDYNGPYRLLLFLPKNSTDPPLQTFLKQEFGGTFQPWKTSIVLPRLHLNTPELLTRSLEDLGMKSAFGSDADFAPMLGAAEHGYGFMFQDVDLTFDEHGTVAKALTEFPRVKGLLPMRPIRFDRPFAFEIVRTGDHPVTLFEGQVLDVQS
ncbi:MAG TPA: serpin family protein [Candidatus Baltobacteraceae bacterium]